MTSSLTANPANAAALLAATASSLNLGLCAPPDIAEQLAKSSGAGSSGSGSANMSLVQQQRAKLQQQQRMLQSQLFQHQQTQPSHYLAAMHQNQGLFGAFPFATSRRHSANAAAASRFVPYQQRLVQELTLQQQIIAQRQQQQQQKARAPSPYPAPAGTAPPVARSLSTPPASLQHAVSPQQQQPLSNSAGAPLSTQTSPQKRPRAN